jgi:hypothetical protein
LALVTFDGEHPQDLGVYLEAAQHLRLGEPIYRGQVDIAQYGWPYVYPPLLAEVFLPFSSYQGAWVAWNIVLFGSWIGALGALLWALREKWDEARPEWRPVLLAALVLWPTVPINFALGQVQLPLLGLLTASWLALRGGHERTGGLLLGAAIAIKPLPAAALFTLVAARHWRTSIAAVSVAAVLFLVSFWIAGWQQAIAYFFQAAPAFDRFMSANANNRTLAMSLALLFGHGQSPEWLARGLSAAVVSASACAAFVWKPSPSRALALGATVLLLASPILQGHYLVLAVLPLSQAYADGDTRERFIIALLFGLLALTTYIQPVPEDPAVLMGLKSGLPVLALLGLLAVQFHELARPVRC